MEKREMDILHILAEESKVTQRDIAQRKGMSLGLVNTLLKKCVQKGLVKIERLNSRNLRYILTPKGIRETALKTLTYIKKSYQAILELTYRIETITQKAKEEGREIWLLGERDEIFELLSKILADMQVKYKVASSPEEISGKKAKAIYYWDPDYQEKLEKYSDKTSDFINILKNRN